MLPMFWKVNSTMTGDRLTIETLPIGYFFDIWGIVKNTASGITLVILRGRISGYLTFEEDAVAIAQLAHLQMYQQKVLNRSKMVKYFLIPDVSIEEVLDALDEHVFILADRTPEDGISSLEILPLVQQMSLF